MSSAGGVAPWASQSQQLGRLPAVVLVRALLQADVALSLCYAAVTLGIALLSAAIVYTSGAAIGAIPAAVRDGADSSAVRDVQMIVLAMGGIFLAQQLCVTVQDMLASTLGRRVEGDLRTRLLRALARPRQLDHLNDPAIQQKIAAASTVGTARYGAGSALFFGTAALNAFLFGMFMAILLATFSWWLSLTVVALYIAIRALVHRESLHYWAALGFQTAGSQRAVYFRDLGLDGAAAKEIRTFGLSDWIVGRFREHWLSAGEQDRDTRRRLRVSNWLAVPIIAISALGFALMVEAARTASIDLHAFAVSAQALVGISILSISARDEAVLTWGAATIPPVWEVEALLAAAPPAKQPAAAPVRELRFDHVRFSYPGRDTPVLSGLDLDIPLGQSTAIVGLNGAGKTTLIKLLCGLVSPSRGAISVDGHSLSDLDLDSWRRHIAVLFQDFVHYPFSAADNVRFGAVWHGGDHETLEKIGGRAGLGELLDEFPARWDTVLSKQYIGGRDISGGQWQRVALARALWAVEAGAKILVLDEPTANLDVRAEARFYEQFLDLSQGLTTILISHRFASVRRADNIVVIEDGVVVERGDHASLMKGNTRYARMFAVQGESYAVDAGDA